MCMRPILWRPHGALQFIVVFGESFREENLVPMERLELSRYCYRGILNPLRLPFRHIGNSASPNVQAGARQSGFATIG